MNKIKSNELSGDLNYIITDYLSKIEHLSVEEKENIFLKLKKDLKFGEMYDLDLNKHPCSFEIRKEIYQRVEKKNLAEVFKSYNNFLTKNDEANSINNDEKEILNTKFGSKFNFFKNSKSADKISLHSNFSVKENVKSFKHMKSMLGHISVQDDNILTPVAIYCLSYSESDELIITGDNNGLIKIWSSRTGALVDIFKMHTNAINDTVLIKDYLISCAEDMSIIIWNIKKLCHVTTLNLEESIIRVLSYEYLNPKSKKISNIVIASSISGKIFIFDLFKIPATYAIDDLYSDNITSSKREKYEYENEVLISKIYFDKAIYEKYPILKKNKNTIQHTSLAAHNLCGLLISGFNDGIMCVWDIQKIIEIAILNNKFIVDFTKYLLFVEGVHDSVIQICEFNKRGDHFITASIDGNVLIWKVQEGVIKEIRQGIQSNTALYPVYSIFKLCESENRVRTTVNSAVWSSNNNYVIAMISSRKKKKSGNTQSPSDTEHESVYKRSSAILVYEINSNLIIKRYDSSNGFNFHDECYVLEPHSFHEDIILTVTNTNEIILLNILTGTILSKFNEENYFFNNIPQSMIASEGKFSSNGDSFVISTYLGSISIYSIYSKNSYSTTYMNQFFDEEFQNAPQQTQIDNPFKKFSNMYNLPYIVQQPISTFKLNQIEKIYFPRLINNYNYSKKEIQHKLYNNYEIYDKNNEERIFECEREERIFIQAAKENLTYMIADNGMDLEIVDESLPDDNSEYNCQEENLHEENDFNNNEEAESISASQLMDIEPDKYSEENEIGMYNLRSRVPNDRNERRRQLISNIREEETARNNGNDRQVRYEQRQRANRSGADLINANTRMINDNDRIVDNAANNKILINKKKRKTLIKRGRRPIKRSNYEEDLLMNDNESIEVQCEEDDFISNNEYSKKDDIKDEFSSNSNYETEFSVPEEITQFGHEIIDLYNLCKELENICFLCKFHSKNLIGPFTTEDYINFKIDNSLSLCTSINNSSMTNILEENNQSLNLKNEKFFFHTDCVLLFNDFKLNKKEEPITTRKGRINKSNIPRLQSESKIDISSTISNIITKNKICYRCKGDYATKKCNYLGCNNYYHGYHCLNIYCKEADNSDIYCIECYKNKSIELEYKIINRKNKNLVINTNMKYNSFSREFFEKEKFSYYTFFPQIGRKVYFILQAYEEYLNKNFGNVLHEIEENENILFWQVEDKDLYRYFTRNPFLCEIIKMEFSFPNEKSISMIKRLNKGDYISHLKIITKIKLKILNLKNTEINIIFIENESPDFLVDQNLYEKTYKKYKKLIDSKEDLITEIVISDTPYKAQFLKIEDKENNEIYKDSGYENLFFQYVDENKETMRVSFWEIFDHSLGNYLPMNILCDISSKIDEIYNKNMKKYKLFLEKVDEEKDGALEYYNIIPVPMYLNLIKNRLNNGFYTNFNSIEFDIKLIEINSLKYNGEDARITKDSKELVKQILSYISTISKECIKENELEGPDTCRTLFTFNGTHNINSNSECNIIIEKPSKNKCLLKQIDFTKALDANLGEIRSTRLRKSIFNDLNSITNQNNSSDFKLNSNSTSKGSNNTCKRGILDFHADNEIEPNEIDEDHSVYYTSQKHNLIDHEENNKYKSMLRNKRGRGSFESRIKMKINLDDF